MRFRRLIQLGVFALGAYGAYKSYEVSQRAYPLGNTDMPAQERVEVVAIRSTNNSSRRQI